jgi:nucleotide-binding universal stress UspA family protein
MYPDSEEASSLTSRKVCLCVWEWSSTTTVLAWAWLKQYFLRKSLDSLYVIHTGKNPDWDRAGPLTSGLEESLAGWQHQVFNFSGSLQSNINKFLKDYDIDLVLVGEDFPRQGMLTKNNPLSSSPSEWVKSHIFVPFMIIRRDSVLSLRGLKISDSEAPLSPMSRRVSSNKEGKNTRRIAVAYSDENLGRKMIELARKMVLLPGDEVYMVHCVSGGNNFVQGYQQTKNIISRLGSKVGVGISPDKTDAKVRRGSGDIESFDSETAGAAPIAGHDITKTVILKGGSSNVGGHKESKDPRHLISDFCKQYSIDLLIIASRSAGRLRKTITGGSVSSYLINRVECPCLVFPLRLFGFSEKEEMTRSLTSVELDSTAEADVDSRNLPDDPSLLKELLAASQKELAAKDELIDALQEEVRMLRLERE